MSSDLDEQLATLAREQGRLETLLDADENWRALSQLEAREARGEALSTVDGTALRARLIGSLKANRLYQARTKILEAITILEESAALPDYAIPPSANPPPEAEESAQSETTVIAAPEVMVSPPDAPEAAAPSPAGITPDIPPTVAEQPEPQPIIASTPEPPPTAPTEVSPPEPASPPSDVRRTHPRATIHAMLPVTMATAPIAAPAPASDLLQIRGITPALAARLQSIGVERARDIAVWTRDDVRRISSALGLDRTISRENWIEQAALIVQKSGEPLPAKPLASPAPAPTVSAQPAIAIPASEPAPQPKPTAQAAVATIVAGAARSIAERIELLRQEEEIEPAPLPRPAPMVATDASDDDELPDDDAGAAPAHHTPIAYAAPVEAPGSAAIESVTTDEPLPEPQILPVHPAKLSAASAEPTPQPPASEPHVAPAVASTLPPSIEARLNTLERDVELTAADEYDEAPPAEHAVNGNAGGNGAANPGRSPAPFVPDIGVATSDHVPDEAMPPPSAGNEAEIEIVRRSPSYHATAAAEQSVAPPAPPPGAWPGIAQIRERFAAESYDAYRGQSEEASVEIVDGNRQSRTRLPGKPRSSEPSHETRAAVRRFLDALRGK